MMKTTIYLILFIVFALSKTGFSQKEEELVGSIWYLNEGVDLQISALYDSNDKLTFYYLQSSIGFEYPDVIFKVKGEQLQFYFLAYSDGESMDTIGKALFQILTLNDSVFSLHPLDVAAVRFLDQMEQPFIIAGEPDRDEKFYDQYWKEISKTKGKKRKTVIEKWKNEHRLDVDETVFYEENWYKEDWDFDRDGLMIDSIYYSEITITNEARDSVHYADYKIYPDGRFVMRQLSAARTANDGIPYVEFNYQDPEPIEFIPPIIPDVEEDAQYGNDAPLYEIEEDVKSGDENPPPVIEMNESADLVYEDGEPEVIVPTADGYYKGTLDEEWMYLMDGDFIAYGPTKQIHLGDSTSYTCVGYQTSYCGKKHFRVFYKGTYKDLWVRDINSPILLSGFTYTFLDRESYMKSFEPLENETEKFPVSFQPKQMKNKK